MVTLAEIQDEVERQLIRDFSDSTISTMRNMLFLGLAEEAGEVAGLVKRVLRDFPQDRVRATKEHFTEELGDVLWYLTACCIISEVPLEEVWEYNIKKLRERYGE